MEWKINNYQSEIKVKINLFGYVLFHKDLDTLLLILLVYMYVNSTQILLVLMRDIGSMDF